ncbi:hypothetical protein B0181_07290, partial [Moraxella caviae]
ANQPTAELTKVGENPTGGVKVTPGVDNDKTVVDFIDENDQPHIITATKNPETGEWTLDKTPEGVSIDPKTGIITFTPDAVRDDSVVSVTGQETGKEPSTPVEVKTPLYDDFDGDGKPDSDTKAPEEDKDTDDDNDGVNNEDEKANGTDPKNTDSDGDGTPDGDEDSDGDGITDGEESDENSNTITDKDGDGIADLIDPATITVDLVNQIDKSNITKAPISGTSTQLPEGTVVTLTVTDKNGKTVETTATIDKDGNYSTTVDLTGLADGVVTAKASANDGKVTATDESPNTLDVTPPSAPTKVEIGNGDDFITSDEIDTNGNVPVKVELPQDAKPGDTVQIKNPETGDVLGEKPLTEEDIKAGTVTVDVPAPKEGEPLKVEGTITDPAGNESAPVSDEATRKDNTPTIDIDTITGVAGNEFFQNEEGANETPYGAIDERAANTNGWSFSGTTTNAAGATVTADVQDASGASVLKAGTTLTATVADDGTWTVEVPAGAIENYASDVFYQVKADVTVDGKTATDTDKLHSYDAWLDISAVKVDVNNIAGQEQGADDADGYATITAENIDNGFAVSGDLDGSFTMSRVDVEAEIVDEQGNVIATKPAILTYSDVDTTVTWTADFAATDVANLDPAKAYTVRATVTDRSLTKPNGELYTNTDADKTNAGDPRPQVEADKPTITPSPTDGSVTVAPGLDNTTVEIGYTNEDDQPKTITVTKGDNGWTATQDGNPLPTTPTTDGTTPWIDADGTVHIPQNGVKDGSDVTATGDNPEDTPATAEPKPAGTDTKADAPTITPSPTDGSVSIARGDDNTKVEIGYTNEDDQPKTITVTKGDNGWTATQDGNPLPNEKTDGTTPWIDADGTVHIPQDGVKDGSPVTATGSHPQEDPADATPANAGNDVVVPLTPPTIALASDTVGAGTRGTTTDGITNNPTVNVTNPSGAAWEYTTDGGDTWIAGTGTSFTMPRNGDIDGQANRLQVRLKDDPSVVSNVINAVYDHVTTVGNITPEVSGSNYTLTIRNLEPGSYVSVSGSASRQGVADDKGNFVVQSPLNSGLFGQQVTYNVSVTDKAGNTATNAGASTMTLTRMPNLYPNERTPLQRDDSVQVIDDLNKNVNNLILVGEVANNATTGNVSTGVAVNRPLNVDTGAGDDSLVVNMIQQVGGNDTNINMGNGNDYLKVFNYVYAQSTGSININMGAGNDIVDLGEGAGNSLTSLVGGRVTVDLGTGNDTIKLAGNAVNPNVTVNGGDGFDTVVFEGAGFGGTQKLLLDRFQNIEEVVLNTSKELDITAAAAGKNGSGSKVFNGVTYQGLFINTESSPTTVDLGDDGHNRTTGFTQIADAPLGYTGYQASTGVVVYIQDGITVI